MAELLAANQITIAKVLDGEQGIPGEKGADGKSSYFHIKYSSVANPTSSSQMTETPSTYIGTYVDFTEADSTDPAKYTWSRFEGIQGEKGEQGIPGVGIDGKTSYLHIAYATSADGSEGFSISESANKTYIGQYTDFISTDSTDPTKYAWTKIKGEMSAEQLAQLNQASKDASTAKDSVDTLSDKTRTGFIETLSGTGFVQSNKTEDGGTSEVVVYGKSVQDGTPTPEAPVEIQSVESPKVTACGKNLARLDNSYNLNALQFSYTSLEPNNIEGSKPTGGNDFTASFRAYLEKGCSYKISADMSGNFLAFYLYKTNTWGEFVAVVDNEFVFSGDSGEYTIAPYFKLTESFYIKNFMLELGTAATDYEQYTGKTATLSDIVLRSVGEAKDRLLKDTDDLWKIERNVGEVDLGNIDIKYLASLKMFYIYPNGLGNKVNSTPLCSLYAQTTFSDLANNLEKDMLIITNSDYIGIRNLAYTDVTSFKNAMKGVKVIYQLFTPTYETLPDRIQAELNALTTYNPITNVFVSAGVTPDIDVSFWTRDYRAKNAAENAAKVATNFIGYDSTNGLVLGNKESGSWVGYRTQIDNDSFNVLDDNGDIIASYGSNEVELGKGNPNAIIKMCDGKAYVKNYIVGSQNTSVFCGQDVTVVGEWEGASEAYALFKQGFINIGQASSHIKLSNENGNMNQVEIQGQNITINGELALGTALSIANGGTGATTAANARSNLGIKDYIIEQGTTNGWEYIKLASRKFIAWKYSTGSYTCTNASGNMYYSGISTWNLPFTIVKGVANISLGQQCFASNVVLDTGAINFRALRGAKASLTNVETHIAVHGTY